MPNSPRGSFAADYADDSNQGSSGETISYIPGKVIVSGTVAGDGDGDGDGDPMEAPPSADFQALAAASADSSLFTFVDEEDDYESDFEVAE